MLGPGAVLPRRWASGTLVGGFYCPYRRVLAPEVGADASKSSSVYRCRGLRSPSAKSRFAMGTGPLGQLCGIFAGVVPEFGGLGVYALLLE